MLAMSLAAAAACGGSDDASLDAPVASVATVDETSPSIDPPSTSPATTTSTSTTVAPVVTATPVTEVASTDDEPVEVPFPAAALPILEAHVMDQPVWNPIGFDDELVFAHGFGVGRLDLTDGSVTTAPLAVGDEPKAELFFAVSDGTMFVSVVDVAGQGTLDRVMTVDPQTLERTGMLVPPGVVAPFPASGSTPRVLAASSLDGPHFFDVEDSVLGEPIGFVDPAATIHTTDGELWTWTAEGLLQVFDQGGQLVGTAETGLSGGRFNSSAPLVTATSVWIADTSTGQLVQIDRANVEIANELDLREHFSWADAVRLDRRSTTDRFVIAHVVAGDEGWWMLVEIDPETGVVLSEHVVATDDFEYGWSGFDVPNLASVGDRLFVRDHMRRIVEVDVAALGLPSPDAWSDPGIGRVPVFTDDEQAIAGLTSQMVNDKVVAGFTDPTLGPLVLDILDSVREEGTWEVVAVEVVGDRAVSRAAPVGENVGGYFVFRFVDGEWLLDVKELCALTGNVDPCPAV